MKRFFAASLLVLLVVPALFAADKYIIDYYDFFFEGNTDTSRVYQYFEFEDNATFDTYEAMAAHVRAKAQSLVDSRIFTSVDYDVLEGDGATGTESPKTDAPVEAKESGSEDVEHHYIAVYKINDKSPFFFFPTPKFDSNYGLKLGLRLESMNFGGKLAKFRVNANMKQNDHSFEKAKYNLEFNIFEYPIASFDMDTSLSFEYDGEKGGLAGTTLGISSMLKDIDVAGFKMDAAASLEFKGIESLADSVLSLSTALYDIKFGKNVDFKLSTGIKFNLDKNELSSFGCKEFSYSASLGNVLKDIGGLSFSHGLSFYPRKDGTKAIPKNLLKTSNSIAYHGLYLKDHKVSLSMGIDTKTIKGEADIEITVSENISVPFELPCKLFLTPSLKFYRVYHTNGSTTMTDWNVDKRIAVGASLKRSTLCYDLDGNSDFRKGMTLSIAASRDMELMNMLNDPKQYVQIQFSWFPYSNSWFNPSIRITGSAAHDSTKYLLRSIEDVPFVADYMRGIRDDSEYNKPWNTKFIANVNLTTKCINLGSWARTYAIPFADIAVLHNRNEEVKMLYTVGIEGIGIINDHPNYPVRASLGFNTESIKTFMETKDLHDLEYELFFGLYYFY